MALGAGVGLAQELLSPAQMREDFNYMMEQYERIHPDPAWSLGPDRYTEMKQQTLARLDHEMPPFEFWRIIGRWNQYFDGHTQVLCPQENPQLDDRDGLMAFPPYSIIHYRDRRIRFSSYGALPDSIRGCEIVSINGHTAKEIIDTILPYITHESEAAVNTRMLKQLHWYYDQFFGRCRQMEIGYLSADGARTMTLDRETVVSWLKALGVMGNRSPRDRP